MEKNESKNIILSVVAVSLLLIAVIGVSYAIFVYTSSSNSENILSTGTISMKYTEGITNIISIENALPINDEVGKKQSEYFDFQISSSISGKTSINYTIIAENITNILDDNNNPLILTEQQLKENEIKIYLEKQIGNEFKEVLSPTIFSNLNKYDNTENRILYLGNIYSDSNELNKHTDSFKLRMWINDGTDLDKVSKTFKVKINVMAES